MIVVALMAQQGPPRRGSMTSSFLWYQIVQLQPMPHEPEDEPLSCFEQVYCTAFYVKTSTIDHCCCVIWIQVYHIVMLCDQQIIVVVLLIS